MVTRLAAIPLFTLPLLAAACSAPSTSSALSQERIPALVRIGESGRQQDIPQVLPSLASDDPLVRWTAQQTLVRLTGSSNGYDWSADRASRERAIEAWRVWCSSRGLTVTPEGSGRA